MDKETCDSFSLTRWLEKSGKPTEDHPELPKERTEKTILKRTQGMPMVIMLKSKIVRMLENKNFPASVKNGMKTQRRAAMTKIVYA